MIIDESAKAKGAKRFALEVFLLSFALEGMNLADLYTCAPAKGRWLIYNRMKTKGRRADDAEHHIYISDAILPIVDRYKDSDGIHMFNFHRRYKDFNTFTVNANNAIRRWREGRKIESFTMYAARHSFASISRRIGIEKATIDEMLCHVGNLVMADVYIEPDWSLHMEENEKLLAEFDWSPTW
jgi:integrase